MPKTKGAKKVDKLQKWQQILADASQPLEYARWLDEDEERFVALNATNIDISNTHYGRVCVCVCVQAAWFQGIVL
jgi:hypothetical protein